MGVVYEAEQEQPRRTVALKVIHPGLASATALRRFEFEAEVLAQLHHPGIAQIYEAGTFDTDSRRQPYFAMELIDGRSIVEYATVNNLDARQRMLLLARVADAVQHAHQRGVIHRDLKPANILVADEHRTSESGQRWMNAVGQPKILDFGVARTTDGGVNAVTMRTSLGELVGTLAYMSPEQAAGSPDELDTRSDVYSLGVLAYELLAGGRRMTSRQTWFTKPCESSNAKSRRRCALYGGCTPVMSRPSSARPWRRTGHGATSPHRRCRPTSTAT